jgi:hypothetical protein
MSAIRTRNQRGWFVVGTIAALLLITACVLGYNAKSWLGVLLTLGAIAAGFLLVSALGAVLRWIDRGDA